MPVYKCTTASKDGQINERIIRTGSPASLKKIVGRKGEFLINVEAEANRFSFLKIFKKQKLKAKDFYSFNKEFLTLIRAGLPAVSAFDEIIKNQRNSYFVNILKNIRQNISDGESLSEAFEKYESLFSPLYIATLQSGEAAGCIPDTIEEFLEYFDKLRMIRQKMIAASVYPLILTACSVFVMVFLLVFVVPVITESFVEANARLPIATTILLRFSDFIRFYYPGIIIVSILLFFILYFLSNTEHGRLFLHTCYLKLPFAGDLLIIYYTTLFSSSLSTVLNGGTPLNQAIKISSGVIGNSFMIDKIQNAVREIEQGKGFARAFGKINIFPAMAIRMFAAGEEGGSLGKILKDVSDFYGKEVENRLSIITSTIEPVLMILMGLIIGSIIVAMYMPIFQLAETIA